MLHMLILHGLIVHGLIVHGYPRSPGLVIRLCLYFVVTPVFIPVREPWRNGVIEKFNDTYNKRFFRRQWFPSYATLKRQSKNFQRFHNKHHRCSFLKGKTPLEVLKRSNYKAQKLGGNTKLPQLDHITKKFKPKCQVRLVVHCPSFFKYNPL